MRSRLLTEAAVLSLVSGGSIFEGFRVIAARDPTTLSDPLGPGAYIVGLGVLLLLTTLGYSVASLRPAVLPAAVYEDEDDTGSPIGKVLASVAALCAYALLIDALGYVIPTFLLLLVESRLFGVTSWWRCAVVAVGLTFVFYFVFLRFANVAFPHGALWG